MKRSCAHAPYLSPWRVYFKADDLDGDADRDVSGFDGRQQAVLAVRKEANNASDEFSAQIGLMLAEDPICLQPALSAHETVTRLTRRLTFGNHDRPLQPGLGDIRDDLLENLLITNSRIDDNDAIRRDQFDLLG